MAKTERYVQARYQHSVFEQHRRTADIGNGGKASGSGGEKAQVGEPREKGEGFGEAGKKGAARDRDRAREHKADQAMHSGIERAMGDHADRIHPVKRK